MKLKIMSEMKALTILSGVLSFFFTVSSCSKEGEPDLSEEGTNEWIYNTMKSYYLWYEDIPAKESLNFSQSADKFFDSLLSDRDGVKFADGWLTFSRIEKKREATKSIDETDSYGFDLATYKDGKTANYYAWVLYVLPGSPAADAGLKRGDWVIAAGADAPNVKNVSTFLNGGATTFLIAKFENGRFVTDRKIDIAASRAVTDTPFLKDSVYSVNGGKVGYLVYNTFSSGPDDKSNAYDEQMKQVFARFKSQHVTDFVLDLRYNQGGLVTCAQLLSSFLAPASALGQTFCSLTYNDRHEKESRVLNYYKNSEISNNNLDLHRIFILTGDMTASASEAVINCLIPYMGRSAITLIGSKTVGKTVGSVTFGTNEKYGWLLHPIVLRVYNAQMKADYANGFSPDIPIDELVTSNKMYPFGDTRDLLLNAAMAQITGQVNKPAVFESERSNSLKLKLVSPGLDRKTKGLIENLE